jgi:PGF-pre-PGF domain-containing protein
MAENVTLNVDTEAPTFVYTLPPDEETFESDESVTCNCSSTDNLDPLPYCSIYNGSCSSSEGTRNITFRAWDHAGNERFLKITYTVEGEEGEEEETTTGGGAETVSVSSSKGDSGAKSEEHCWDTITAGSALKYEVDNDIIGIKKITIIPKSSLGGACLEVKQVISVSAADVEAYSDSEKVYKYFKIEPEGMSDSDLTNVIIEFSVAKTWLYNHKRDSVDLNRYKNGWKSLGADDLDEDTDFVYYAAESSGFSDFVITGDAIARQEIINDSCGNAVCEINENSTNCCQDCGCPEGSECRDNQCFEKSQGLITGWLGQFQETIRIDWLNNQWLFGLPIWSFVILGVMLVGFIVFLVFFKDKLHFKFPYEIDFSIHKKPSYGFK